MIKSIEINQIEKIAIKSSEEPLYLQHNTLASLDPKSGMQIPIQILSNNNESCQIGKSNEFKFFENNGKEHQFKTNKLDNMLQWINNMTMAAGRVLIEIPNVCAHESDTVNVVKTISSSVNWNSPEMIFMKTANDYYDTMMKTKISAVKGKLATGENEYLPPITEEWLSQYIIPDLLQSLVTVNNHLEPRITLVYSTLKNEIVAIKSIEDHKKKRNILSFFGIK